MTASAGTPIELVNNVYASLEERVAIGRKRLGRNLTLTAAAVLTSAVSLLLVGSTFLIQRAFENLLVQWRGDVEMIVFVRSDASAEQIALVDQVLRASPTIIDVDKLRYLNKTESYEEAKRIFAGDPVTLGLLTPETIPTQFKVVPLSDDPTLVRSLSDQYRTLPGVEAVALAEDEFEVDIHSDKELAKVEGYLSYTNTEYGIRNCGKMIKDYEIIISEQGNEDNFQIAIVNNIEYPILIIEDKVQGTNDLRKKNGEKKQALGNAIVRATKLGTTLDSINKQGESLIDFESSISREFEAQVLTGKNINLTRARELALMGDTRGLMEELNRQNVDLGEYQNMNLIQRKAFADAIKPPAGSNDSSMTILDGINVSDSFNPIASVGNRTRIASILPTQWYSIFIHPV